MSRPPPRRSPVILMVAKAPIPGRSKTRLSPPLSQIEAANLAAACLLDTVETCRAAATELRTRLVVAITGDLHAAVCSAEIGNALRGCHVISQRGAGFARRLRNAHADAAGSHAIVQVGTDTPQLTPDLVLDAAAGLVKTPAALGFTRDGGWWLLGLRDARDAAALDGVAMSTPHTGAGTLAALRDRGLSVRELDRINDVDTIDDVLAVAPLVSDTRFGRVAIGLLAREEAW